MNPPTGMPGSLCVEQVAAADVLDQAYAWLCARRKRFPDACDIWTFRRRWSAERAQVRDDLIAGRYRFGLLSRRRLRTGEEVDIWSARDALVLKCLALVLTRDLPISRRCCHVKGNGGSKRAVRDVWNALPRHRFVLRTDVRHYYASIDHELLLARLDRSIADARLLSLLGQYLARTAERGGLYWHYSTGIPLGCPLSPIIGAFFLAELDEEFERQGVFFRRYMDDVLVLAPTRWKLRRAVLTLNRALTALGLDKHPDKTFIGRVERGFDFLGYRFAPGGLSIADQTARAFLERVSRLYERERGAARQPAEWLARRRALGEYVRRWVGWARGSIPIPVSRPPTERAPTYR